MEGCVDSDSGNLLPIEVDRSRIVVSGVFDDSKIIVDSVEGRELKNFKILSARKDSPPEIIAAKDVRFIVVSPLEDRVNLPNAIDSEIIEIVHVNDFEAIVHDDFLPTEEHEFGVFSFENGVDSIEPVESLEHPMELGRRARQKSALVEPPQPGSLENHRLAANKSNGVDSIEALLAAVGRRRILRLDFVRRLARPLGRRASCRCLTRLS